MLKISATLLFFLFSVPLFSQQKSDFSNQSNELKLNLVTSALSLPEISYERILTDKIALGVSITYSFEKVGLTSLKYSILPYARVYFGQNRASGFYFEVNMLSKTWNRITKITDILDSNGKPIGQTYTTEPSKNIGFGGAVGYKAHFGSSWLMDIYVGGGKLTSGALDGFAAYPRGGISVGKRF